MKKKGYTISPTSLRIFEECPRCFWLRFNKGIKRPNIPFPSLPSGIDRVVKEYFDSYRAKKNLPLELKGLKGTKLFKDFEKLDEWRTAGKGLRWDDKKGNIVRGALDDLLEKNKKLIVLDYKTRGFPVKEDTAGYSKTQLEVYTMLLNKIGYETQDYAYLLFYYPKNVEGSNVISFHTDLVKVDVSVKNAESIVKKALKTLKGKMPDRSEGCEYCRWAEEYRGF